MGTLLLTVGGLLLWMVGLSIHRTIVESEPWGWWALLIIHIGAIMWLQWDHLGSIYAIFIAVPMLVLHWRGFEKYWERKLDDEERYERKYKH